ncbi:MAG TPA: hypothetical protein VFX02_05135 [Gammaproteobacteria bacterium]|nr:hypothetical protein [Gammaproteobacteria bacterium]
MHALRSHLVVISLIAGLGMAQFASAQARLPESGLDKSAVETRFGAPQRVEGPVGEPPITKWIYADFIVVFEYDHVVHTVQRQPAVEQGSAVPSEQPAPAPAAGIPETGTDTGNASASGASAGAQPGVDASPETATPADRQSGGDTLDIPAQ